MRHINSLALMLKAEFKIPIIKAKIIAINEKTYNSAIEFLAQTSEDWCWNIPNYRDSGELKELRNKNGHSKK